MQEFIKSLKIITMKKEEIIAKLDEIKDLLKKEDKPDNNRSYLLLPDNPIIMDTILRWCGIEKDSDGAYIIKESPIYEYIEELDLVNNRLKRSIDSPIINSLIHDLKVIKELLNLR